LRGWGWCARRRGRVPGSTAPGQRAQGYQQSCGAHRGCVTWPHVDVHPLRMCGHDSGRATVRFACRHTSDVSRSRQSLSGECAIRLVATCGRARLRCFYAGSALWAHTVFPRPQRRHYCPGRPLDLTGIACRCDVATPARSAAPFANARLSGQIQASTHELPALCPRHPRPTPVFQRLHPTSARSAQQRCWVRRSLSGSSIHARLAMRRRGHLVRLR
jgi:hypothetical protein